MKIVYIIVIIIIGLITAVQVYITMATRKTETQAYKVIRVEENFEIRYYSSATMAMICSHTKSYRDLGYAGFNKLAGYIFGGNSEKKQIAMTSPVHMDIGDTSSTMAFVLPSAYDPGNLPKPNDSDVSIKTSEPEYVAAIRFGGFASSKRITTHIDILEKALRQKGLSYHGNFRFLSYNPPYQLFGRRNEVIVALNADEIN
jgi:SOUL heme-binding protein